MTRQLFLKTKKAHIFFFDLGFFFKKKKKKKKRTRLPSPGFARAVQNVPMDSTPASAEAVMQQNYPKGVYCQGAVFAAGGYDACVAAAG